MFVDIVFPTAVRSTFTYSIPPEKNSGDLIGKRVWAPFRNYFAIGVIVRTHNRSPKFETKPVKQILDEKPVLSQQMLELTEWIHQFYFCSWGEVIQAALPAGLNFVSKKYAAVSSGLKAGSLNAEEKEIVSLIGDDTKLESLQKQLRGTGVNRALNRLIKKGVLEIWEQPDIKITSKKETFLKWPDAQSKEKARQFLDNLQEKNKWQRALETLIELKLPIKRSALSEYENLTPYTIKKLHELGWIEAEHREAPITDFGLPYEPDSIKSLNTGQLEAYNAIKLTIDAATFANFLLYGVTGSGKTEVYIHALKRVRELGKGGIVLVPEIALTPQTVARFYKIFGDEIAVLHSRMTPRERLLAWQSLQNGEKKIAIGPRSAVFAPVQNLGLIILDEEHDASYKQVDPAPRYHAREVAIMRARTVGATVIMGSATPSLQALNMAAKNKAEMLQLSQRHADASLPKVEIIDLTEYKGAMRGPFSVALFGAMEEALSRNEQVILLYNRRGYSSYLQCNSCGHIPQSPDCAVSLTYHKYKNQLMCHYSGYSRRADTICELCGSDKLIVQGSGTQQIEEEVGQWFPGAKVLRFDKDSTTKKGAHERILTAFSRHEADILVGTQLVSKGLDFASVTVVGVIDADTEQAYPSFNSSERLYQLLSQVAGRSGRGDKAGKVFIQTRQSNNPAIQFAKMHDHKSFARQEMAFRKELNYPPYSRLVQFVFKGKEETRVRTAAQLMKQLVGRMLPTLEILGPAPSAISWMNKNYFWEMSIKIDPTKGAKYIEGVLLKVLDGYENSRVSGQKQVRVNINVDANR